MHSRLSSLICTLLTLRTVNDIMRLYLRLLGTTKKPVLEHWPSCEVFRASKNLLGEIYHDRTIEVNENISSTTVHAAPSRETHQNYPQQSMGLGTAIGVNR